MPRRDIIPLNVVEQIPSLLGWSWEREITIDLSNGDVLRGSIRFYDSTGKFVRSERLEHLLRNNPLSLTNAQTEVLIDALTRRLQMRLAKLAGTRRVEDVADVDADVVP